MLATVKMRGDSGDSGDNQTGRGLEASPLLFGCGDSGDKLDKIHSILSPPVPTLSPVVL